MVSGGVLSGDGKGVVLIGRLTDGDANPAMVGLRRVRVRSQDEGRDRSAGIAGSTGWQIEFQSAAGLPCRRLVTTSLPINVSVRAVEDLATGASRRVPERLLGRPAQSRRVAQAAVPGQADAHQGLPADASRPEGTRRPERPARRVTGGRGGAAPPGFSMAEGSV